MKWLVTVRHRDDIAQVSERLRELGCERVDTSSPVPTSGDEVAIAVIGPPDLPALVRGFAPITGVWNDSDLTLT